jgi:hypothetical protein
LRRCELAIGESGSEGAHNVDKRHTAFSRHGANAVRRRQPRLSRRSLIASNSAATEVRLEYATPGHEIERVLVALGVALADEGEVWLDPQHLSAHRREEDVSGIALVEVLVTSRAWAHRMLRRALEDIDPDRQVIVGGDHRLTSIRGR